MSFSNIDGYAIVANLSVGSDGSPLGIPELSVGTSPLDQSTGRVAWDPNLLDGFDSGWVHMELDVDARGGAGSVLFKVGNTTVSYSSAAYSEIQGFILRAGVNTFAGSVSFRNVSAQFFRGSSAQGEMQMILGDEDSASTMGTGAADDEGLEVVAPDGGGFRYAKIFADVRMQSPFVVAPTALFGQVFIYAAPPDPVW